MKKELEVGDVVYLKSSGNNPMTVKDIAHIPFGKKDAEILCAWFERGRDPYSTATVDRLMQISFPAACLTLVPPFKVELASSIGTSNKSN